MTLRSQSALLVFAVVALGFASLCVAQTSPPTPLPDTDQALVAGARVELAAEGQSIALQVVSGSDGRFSFNQVAPGKFHLTITAAGFTTRTFSGDLRSGEIQDIPPIALPVAPANTEVQVSLSPFEIAQDQVKEEEQQRVLSFIPNFYVTYDHDAEPLNAKQKFGLAWKTTIDPFSIAIVAAVAGAQQAQNDFSGYGQGAQGYAKRFGASYADLVAGTFIGSAILPSLLKQDPRYFYKGTGTRRSRILYALASAVICKGDNRHWQPNYSNILGNFAAGGLSNLYYSSSDRNGVGLTLENSFIGIGSTGAANLFEEFVVRKFTPHLPSHAASGN
jgi:hypothetical protein